MFLYTLTIDTIKNILFYILSLFSLYLRHTFNRACLKQIVMEKLYWIVCDVLYLLIFYSNIRDTYL